MCLPVDDAEVDGEDREDPDVEGNENYDCGGYVQRRSSASRTSRRISK